MDEMVDTIQGADLDTRLSIYRMMQEGRMFGSAPGICSSKGS